ncbi:UNVERIFIED_CONTAM: hypothetical protein K2H54_053766 [Gekko kuhli]
MDKTSRLKPKKTTGTPQSVTTYFSKDVFKQPKARGTVLLNKMAGSQDSEDEDDSTLSHQDFILMIQKLEEKVAQAVELALETATTAQEDIQHLQTAEEWSRNKIMIAENKLKDRNLKFRGILEQAECEVQLKIFLASWIETLMYRKTLKPITSKLQEHNVRFKWLLPCELAVSHQGTCLLAHDLNSGYKLLNTLTIAHDLPAPSSVEEFDSQHTTRGPRWTRSKKGIPP